jgi:uncharacterized protein
LSLTALASDLRPKRLIFEKTMATLGQIWIFPIKSLDGVLADRATFAPGGSLANDREFALFDDQNKVINGKRTAKIQLLRARFDRPARTVTLSIQDGPGETFSLDADWPSLNAWLSEYFGFPVHLAQDRTTGFPDDLNAPGPTVISTATLQQVADWFPELSLAEVRRRFRTNLEISQVPAFWEDHLFSADDSPPPFTIGTARFQGINPCQRCIVPTRDALQATPTSQFQTRFTAQRRATLPATVAAGRFNHFYRLAVNTRVHSIDGELHTGDAVHLGDDSD